MAARITLEKTLKYSRELRERSPQEIEKDMLNRMQIIVARVLVDLNLKQQEGEEELKRFIAELRGINQFAEVPDGITAIQQVSKILKEVISDYQKRVGACRDKLQEQTASKNMLQVFLEDKKAELASMPEGSFITTFINTVGQIAAAEISGQKIG